ncbi:MAG: carbamoyltransferase C-terminal domain-containing protein [Verrucomicrobiota bacterium]
MSSSSRSASEQQQQVSSSSRSEAGIDEEDISVVTYYENPRLMLDRITSSLQQLPERQAKETFEKMRPAWTCEKADVAKLVREQLPSFRGELLCARHHQSHAASAFYPSPFNEAAILTIDGVGEWATTAIAQGEGSKLQLIEDLRFPHSLGLFYSAETWQLGFKVNSGEYKMMGLAPYGSPVYQELLEDNVIELHTDGSLRLNPEYFCFSGAHEIATPAWERLLGEPRRVPESRLTQFHWDLAASVQKITEKAMLGLARRAREVTGSRNLCMAGGVALNCVGNGKLLKANIFDKIWIQPAAGDAGNAVGAAFAALYIHQKAPRSFLPDGAPDRMQDSLLGPSFSSEEIRDFLDLYGFPYEVLDEAELPRRVSSILQDSKVLGLFQGRMEFGPRALGARSIIADPRSREMQRRLNLKIKFRESFRPFAPIVLEEHCSEWFDLDTPSPYMLLVAPVKEEHRLGAPDQTTTTGGDLIEFLNQPRSTLPAITHVDFSARVQSVSKNSSANRLRPILETFQADTGVPVLINTSFNLRSEPIVCTPADAYRCMMRSDMDCLLMENILVVRDQQPRYLDPNEDWQNEFELD